jgi:hypothetical protein
VIITCRPCGNTFVYYVVKWVDSTTHFHQNLNPGESFVEESKVPWQVGGRFVAKKIKRKRGPKKSGEGGKKKKMKRAARLAAAAAEEKAIDEELDEFFEVEGEEEEDEANDMENEVEDEANGLENDVEDEANHEEPPPNVPNLSRNGEEVK